MKIILRSLINISKISILKNINNLNITGIIGSMENHKNI